VNGLLKSTPIEAVATFYGTSICQFLPIQHIFLKSDSQMVNDAIVSTAMGVSLGILLMIQE
jgi:hypothetical protein